MKKSHLLAYGIVGVLFAATGYLVGTRPKPAPEPVTMTPVASATAPAGATAGTSPATGTPAEPAAGVPAAGAPAAGAPAAGAPAGAQAPSAGDDGSGAVQALFAQWLPDDKGTQQSLAQWRGKPLLVNFWAPWCAPCVQEMPELAQLQAGGKYKDLQVIGIGIDTPANIAQFNQKFKIAFPLLVGGASGTELSRMLGNAQGGLPFTVLISADGRVKKAYLGRLNFSKLEQDLAAP